MRPDFNGSGVEKDSRLMTFVDPLSGVEYNGHLVIITTSNVSSNQFALPLRCAVCSELENVKNLGACEILDMVDNLLPPLPGTP